MSTTILGISAYYHDSAAALIRDGEIVAAAQEERFTRIKHDQEFPARAIDYCLSEAGIDASRLDHVAFYDKPFLKFERILETYLSYAPRGYRSFIKAIPLWLKKKIWIKSLIQEALPGFAGDILFSEHHQSHAASAFFPSPFDQAAIITADGVGEWATTSIAAGKNNQIDLIKEIHFPNSLGLLYSAFTYYTGFKVNSGEYKVMGLAPYGQPLYVNAILDNLIDVKADGSFRLNMAYFNYAAGLTMTNEKFNRLFGAPAREKEGELRRLDMDLARSLQEVVEQVMLKMARHAREITECPNLCLAGGVALNCVANGKMWLEKIFDHIWIQPAAGDAGGAIGAALAVWHQYLGKQRAESRKQGEMIGRGEKGEEGGAWRVERGDGKGETMLRPNIYPNLKDRQKGSFLGPEFSDKQIRAFLDEKKIPFQEFGIRDSEFGIRDLEFEKDVLQINSQFPVLNSKNTDNENKSDLFMTVAQLLAEENVIGWFQGRMEFGPRALGTRSILGDARSPDMQKKMNLKIKFRESFRPFAPAVLAEEAADYFEFEGESPYMLMTAAVKKEKRKEMNKEAEDLRGLEMLKVVRSEIPAVTHVDYSARLQTVDKMTNPFFWRLLTAFKTLTGCPLLVNTSFNVRGEPIVCTPQDAYRCFMRTEMDYLVLGRFLLDKKQQPPSMEKDNWNAKFELD